MMIYICFRMSNLPVDYDSIAASLAEEFRQLYATSSGPKIFRAPGRVNLIGEHTDYNEGFVMPAAIDFDTWVAIAKREDRELHVRSKQFHEDAKLLLNNLSGPPRKHWTDFPRGVAAVLQASGRDLSGADLIVDGRVPIGAGLSSSASIEVAIALALLAVSNTDIRPIELVKVCQRAEHQYVGTLCGIMDQFIAVFGRAGHALMLDCRSLQYEALEIPANVRLVICNSMVKHELAAGEYNLRRADCETGVSILRKHLPNATALRDVTIADLEKYRGDLPEVVYRRCRHVISENQRVLDAAKALQSGDLLRFGKLMGKSHKSLRDDYEVSSRELDLLVELASGREGVFGTRMTGGGFGGCTITLVRSDMAERFQHDLAEAYKAKTAITPDVWICTAAQGAGAWQERS
jgi:galactokinase